MHAPRSSARSTRVVLLALLLTALNLRAAIAVVPPLLDRVAAGVDLSATQAGLLGSLAPAAFAVAGVLAPRLLRRAAAEHVVVGALVFSAALQAARALTGGDVAFLVTSGLALAGLGVGNVVLPVLVKTWFPTRIAALTSAYITLVTLGTAVPAALAVPVADAVGADGWRVALGLWAVTALAVTPLWWSAVRTPRAVVPARDEVRPHLPVWRSRTAWGITLVFGMCSLHVYSMIQWLPAVLVDAGLSEVRAGTALSVFAAFGLPGSLVVPFVVARYPRSTAWVVLACAACFAAGDLGLLLAPAAAPLLWAAVCGLGGGGFPAALTLVGLRTRTPSAAGVVSGFAQGIGYGVAVLGPLSFGVLHDATGAWTASFGVLLAVTVLMAAGGVLAGGGRTVEADLERRPGPDAGRPAAQDGPPVRADTLGS